MLDRIINRKRKFPVLQTTRLILRKLDVSDEEALYKLFRDEKVRQFMDNILFVNTLHAKEYLLEQETHFQNKRGIVWGLSFKGTDELLGICQLGFLNPKTSRLSVALQSEYWRMGVMTEALTRIKQFALMDMEVNRLEAEIIPENEKGIRLFERMGFVKEGVLREKAYWNNRYHDLCLYSLLKKDLKS